MSEPVDPKTAFGQAFQKLGGVAGMVKWGRNHRQAFYTLYAKLIPLHVSGSVTARVESAEDSQAVLHRVLSGIIAARKAAVDISQSPAINIAAPPIEDVTINDAT